MRGRAKFFLNIMSYFQRPEPARQRLGRVRRRGRAPATAGPCQAACRDRRPSAGPFQINDLRGSWQGEKSLDIASKSSILTANYSGGPESEMGAAEDVQEFSASIDGAPDTDEEIEMDDDELLFDELDEEAVGEEVAETESPAEVLVETPGWRRVEMMRETKLLKSELADFDDYDWMESAMAIEVRRSLSDRSA